MALLAGLVLLGFLVLDPFIVPIVWAAILAFVTWPGYVWLIGKCRGRATVAALAMTAVVSVAVIAPIAWLAVVVRFELVHAYHETQSLLAGGTLPPAILKLPWIGDQLRDLAARAAQDPHALGAELRNITDHSLEQIGHVVGNIGRNVAKLLLTVISLFFVYRDGARVAAQLARALEQMLGPRVDNYLEAIGRTVKAVVYGLVLAAVVQGVLVGLGYWAAGVGAPVFLAALTTVCGLIPFAAPAIWACATGWLLLEGNTVAGIGAPHLGRRGDGLDRSRRAAVPHQPRSADPVPGGAVRRARGTRGLRARGTVHRPGDPGGAARHLARMAAREPEGLRSAEIASCDFVQFN